MALLSLSLAPLTHQRTLLARNLPSLLATHPDAGATTDTRTNALFQLNQHTYTDNTFGDENEQAIQE